MECPECGRKLPQGKNRCIYCGGVAAETADTPDGRTGTMEPGDRKEAEIRVEDGSISWADGSSGRRVDPVEGGSFDYPAGFSMDQKAIVRHLGIRQSKRRKPMSRVLQVLIFFASAAIAGALVWLIG